jgi:hypothetical protein
MTSPRIDVAKPVDIQVDRRQVSRLIEVLSDLQYQTARQKRKLPEVIHRFCKYFVKRFRVDPHFAATHERAS